jgi:hypothetical protein
MDMIVYVVVWKDSDGVEHSTTHCFESSAQAHVDTLGREGVDASILEWDVS